MKARKEAASSLGKPLHIPCPLCTGATRADHVWTRWFAAEIIGNLLDVEPRKWRRPRRIEFWQNKERVKKFKQKYDKFDWTGMIERS